MSRPARNSVNRLLLAALAATPLWAAAASGEFTFVTGEVSLTKANGQRFTPARGTPVDAGDRVATGANGMAQLTMVDQARLSLRPATQFVIEAYPERRDGNESAILSLVKGTLRTFTGLLASANRDKFVMKTRVATVGIRGSGNILYSCDPGECDESVTGGTKAGDSITVNHTIEGSHAVTNSINDRPGLPAQQGGAQTLITGPGQTVVVAGNQPPRYIPTPSFIANVATNMTAAKASETRAASGGTTADTRNFSPGDVPALPASQQVVTPFVGNNGLGFASGIDATANLGADPIALRDIVIATGSPFSGQARAGDVVSSGNDLRGYTSYTGAVAPFIGDGSLRESTAVFVDGAAIYLGRYDNATLGFFGAGSGVPIPGSIHWVIGTSGYPTYLSDVLTGSATYTLAAATAPTNQNNTAGTFGATLNANFTSRTLGFSASVTIPAASGNAGGIWQLSASNVPFAFNSFFASTANRLVISNGSATSATNTNLTGSFEGSFVGNGIGGAILGYGIADRTAASSAAWNFVTGVAAFSGVPQNGAAPYREGRISDPSGTLVDFIRSYATTDRPDEVASDATGRVTAFSAPFSVTGGSHSNYAIGTAQVVQSGIDPETGMVWGRWGGGIAVVTREGQSVNLPLGNASLHYIFAGSQSGPVSLPLTGTASYSVIGSTSPTNSAGGVGTLNSATLNANFTNRTVDASVNILIGAQTWTGAANGMPIYRDQYFSAYTGTPIAGLPNPAPLVIGCTPSCGANASGSFDGFFTGRTGQRAGLTYNLGGNQGVVAFGRPPGGG